MAINNNRVERAVKTFVIGRKNWVFSNTAKGAPTYTV
ncbi:MAG: IS66 family transposase [Gammaproteobacteria bacterium]|nr:IS66 family transposase [Gammaproteobacteria bacterium]